MKPRSAVALPLADRDRLARILGMLGSDYPGERDNAARMAAAFVRERGTTWPDILGARPLDDPATRPQPSTDDPLTLFRSLDRCCQFVLAQTPLLNDWEREFVQRLPGFTRLSEKQTAILRRLVVRAIAAGATP
jgi:hypothetical protein